MKDYRQIAVNSSHMQRSKYKPIKGTAAPHSPAVTVCISSHDASFAAWRRANSTRDEFNPCWLEWGQTRPRGETAVKRARASGQIKERNASSVAAPRKEKNKNGKLTVPTGGYNKFHYIETFTLIYFYMNAFVTHLCSLRGGKYQIQRKALRSRWVYNGGEKPERGPKKKS